MTQRDELAKEVRTRRRGKGTDTKSTDPLTDERSIRDHKR
jgi:hypothetical protein